MGLLKIFGSMLRLFGVNVKSLPSMVLAQFVILAKAGRRLDSSRIQIFFFAPQWMPTGVYPVLDTGRA
jgi:hypothetical protein